MALSELESAPTRRGHIPALDGVRAIAILAVLARHYTVVYQIDGAGPLGERLHAIAELGSHGVDLFFALSGFLITGILLDTRGDARYFSTFYARRSLRIFPLYYAYLFLVLGLLRPLFAWRYGQDICPGVVPWRYATYLSNWMPGTGANDDLLGHIWSLAVEEQFYLAWPLVVFLCPGRWLGRTCLAIAAASLTLRVAMVHYGYDGETIYRATPTRMDCLATGALFAIWFRDRVARARLDRATPPLAAALAAGIGLIAWLSGGFHRLHPMVLTAGYSLTAAASGLLVYVAARSEGRLAATLSWSPLRSVGKYSYGLYVLNFLPLFLYYRFVAGRLAPKGAGGPTMLAYDTALIAALAVACYVMAWCSFRFWESPFLRLKDRFGYGRSRRGGDDVPQPSEAAARDLDAVEPEAVHAPPPGVVVRAPETTGAPRDWEGYQHTSYFPELDGLRAISIVCVISVHMHDRAWEWLRGGYGVTLFFVLSGYLITTLALREERKRGRLCLSAFYVRRSLRIFPAYYATLAIYCLLIFGTTLRPESREVLRQALPYYVFYLQDVVYFYGVGDNPNVPFVQSWSLGVEEKFYLAWPLLGFGLLAGLRGARLACCFGLTAMLLSAPWLAEFGYGRAANMLLPHGQILAGCLVAILLDDPIRFRSLAVLGRGAGPWLLAAALAAAQVMPGIGPGARRLAFVVASAALLTALLTGGGAVARALSWRPLVVVGRLSYGIYLLHFFGLNAAEKIAKPGSGRLEVSALALALAFLISTAMAAIMARVIEDPCIALARRISARLIEARASRAVVPSSGTGGLIAKVGVDP